MKIINRSIRIIDYTSKSILSRETPNSFDEYVIELISHINSNEKVRNYKTRSNTTQVICCSLQILKDKENEEFVLELMNGIADRLLRTEIDAQARVDRLSISVKKGSLIQALLYDESVDAYSYLLAKVEHSDFVDDSDFSFKTGFSRSKKNIWKSCLFDLGNPEANTFDVKVYSDTKAKFWSDGFLELDEMVSDEVNTVKAFKAIDETLNRSIKKVSLEDYTYIRNAFISYFRNHDFIDYSSMIEDVVGSYQPAEFPAEKFNDFKSKLNSLPQKKVFDYQFNSVSNAINARIKKTYKVYDGIEIKITSDIPDIKNTIKAYQDEDGIRYIRIKTNDEDTYQSFK